MKLYFLIIIPYVALATLCLNAMDNSFLTKKNKKRGDLAATTLIMCKYRLQAQKLLLQ